MAKQRTSKTKQVKRVTKYAGAKAKANKPKAGRSDTSYLSWIDAYSPEHAYSPELIPEPM